MINNKIDFSNSNWKQESVIMAYTFRFTETPEFTQLEDCITTCVNQQHPEGFDNISILTTERYGVGVDVKLICAFEGWGCPEIIIVEKLEDCEDGVLRYGPCFEIVLYKNGVNIWRHFRDDGRCHWHKRLGVEFPVSENQKHVLHVQILDKNLLVEVDNHKFELRTEDLPEKFHVGLTGCEGIARIYEMSVEEKHLE